MYYGAFLGIMVALLTVLLAIRSRGGRRERPCRSASPQSSRRSSCVAAYAQPYMDNARTLGMRDLDDVSRFSAQLVSYVTAPPQNWLWGWTSVAFDGDELHLFPGPRAVVLAVFAFGRQVRAEW